MYVATTVNGRSESKVYFYDVHLRQGERLQLHYNCLLRSAVRFVHHGTSISRTAAKISLPTMTYESVFKEVSKTSSTDQLCCSSSSLEVSCGDRSPSGGQWPYGRSLIKYRYRVVSRQCELLLLLLFCTPQKCPKHDKCASNSPPIIYATYRCLLWGFKPCTLHWWDFMDILNLEKC